MPRRSQEETTVRELVAFGFEEALARAAVQSIDNPADTQTAINWLLDHGEEDRGGAVEFVHCPHVSSINFDCFVKRNDLVFRPKCMLGCRGEENWLCSFVVTHVVGVMQSGTAWNIGEKQKRKRSHG